MINLDDLKQSNTSQEMELPKEEKELRDETDRLLEQLEKENGMELKPLTAAEAAKEMGLTPKKEDNTPKPTNSVITSAFESCTTGIERAKKDMDKNIQEIKAEIENEKIEKELAEADGSSEELNFNDGTIIPYKFPHELDAKDIELSDFDINDDDIEVDIDDEDSDMDEESKTEEETIADFKKELKEKVRPFEKVIDLSTFKVSKKPVALNTALKITEKDNVEQWIIPSDNRLFNARELSGLSIEKLNSDTSDKNLMAVYGKVYKEIYDHIIDPNKPSTLEQWTKVTKFSDLLHIYFGLYKATFKGRNYIPYNCPKCNYNFVSENIDMNKMYKFKNKEIEESMLNLLRHGNITSTEENNNIQLYRKQVSNKYVIDFRDPSIYNIVFENALLPETFRVKYANLLSILSFIDNIYIIDIENEELKPIDLKIYPNNTVKTLEDKIVRYSRILKTLNSDQLTQIGVFVNEIDVQHDEITYHVPEYECPKCGTKIPAFEVSPDNLLFTRHRLVTVANS